MELNIIPSLGLQAGFVALSLIVSLWWCWIAGNAYSGPSNIGRGFNFRAAMNTGIFLIILTGILLLLSQQGWMHTFETFPPPGLRVFIALLIFTAVLATSPIGKRIASNTPILLLVGFQVFRIPVELLIHHAATQGIAPMEMTYSGRNMDILSGITAVILALFLFRGHVSSKWILGWNLLSLALLINVVGTAILTMPHPLQVIPTDTPNIWVTFSPFILLPGVLVCSALFGHLLVFRHLRINKHSQNGIGTSITLG